LDFWYLFKIIKVGLNESMKREKINHFNLILKDFTLFDVVLSAS